MSERLRKLMDSAVAGTRPRVAEPAVEVVRRSRARSRRLSVAVAAIGVLAVAGGVAAVVGRPDGSAAPDAVPAATGQPDQSTDAQPTPTGPVAPPPTPTRAPGLPPLSAPHVEGDRIVSGGFSIAIPNGWTVVGRPYTDSCQAPQTVTIGWSPHRGGGCTLDRILSVEGPEPGQTTGGSMYTIQGTPAPPTAQFNLPGGEPAYVGVSYSSPNPFREGPDLRTVGLLLPWTATRLTLNVGSTDLSAILATIRTEPVGPARLVLHPDAVAGYFVPAGSEPVAAVLMSQAAANRIRDRLLSLTETVPAGQECGSASEPAAAVYLFPSQGASLGNDLIVITESATCAQATSADGGRVRVPRGLIDELRGYATGAS